jgi:N-hydroxyarylamine O-acetyltransferase
MSDDVNLNAYFERIGFAGSIAPNLQTLQALQLAHLLAIPFENLNPLLDLPVNLDLKSLEQKLLHERRGGYCFEQNTLFLHVLKTLGYEVTGHAARVIWGLPADAVTARSHMMLTVVIGAQTYLPAGGCGPGGPTAPLRLRSEIEQDTPHEMYRLTGEDPALTLEMRIGETWMPCYRFDLVAQHPIDYDVFNWHVATHPDSTFRRELRVARPEKGQRIALRDTEFSTHVTGGETTRRRLTSAAEIRQVLSENFGIGLPAAELLDPVLERIVGAAPEPH